jgi:hypothetical protein
MLQDAAAVDVDCRYKSATLHLGSGLLRAIPDTAQHVLATVLAASPACI